MLTGEQLRAARAVLRLDQSEVAKAAEVSLETVKRLERMQGTLAANQRTVERLTRAFEAAGVTFSDADGKACICYAKEPK